MNWNAFFVEVEGDVIATIEIEDVDRMRTIEDHDIEDSDYMVCERNRSVLLYDSSSMCHIYSSSDLHVRI